MVSPNLERKRFNASGIEGMDPNSSWHGRWSWTRASRRLSSWQVLKPLLRCCHSTSRHQMQARRGVAKPRANYIELHWLRLDAGKKDQIAAMQRFFMLLSSVIVVCSSKKFPVSEFLEFQNVGVGRSTTPSTGLWTLGALSREMWFNCELNKSNSRESHTNCFRGMCWRILQQGLPGWQLCSQTELILDLVSFSFAFRFSVENLWLASTKNDRGKEWTSMQFKTASLLTFPARLVILSIHQSVLFVCFSSWVSRHCPSPASKDARATLSQSERQGLAEEIWNVLHSLHAVGDLAKQRQNFQQRWFRTLRALGRNTRPEEIKIDCHHVPPTAAVEKDEKDTAFAYSCSLIHEWYSRWVLMSLSQAPPSHYRAHRES